MGKVGMETSHAEPNRGQRERFSPRSLSHLFNSILFVQTFHAFTVLGPPEDTGGREALALSASFLHSRLPVCRFGWFELK